MATVFQECMDRTLETLLSPESAELAQWPMGRW